MDSKTDDIIKRRSKLSPAKQAILEKRLQGESEPDIQQIVIPRRTQKSPITLSAPQQRLWFLQQLEPQSSIYNEFACIQLKGVLNCAALEKSFNEIVKRHESLRTSFETLDDQPVQVIHPTLSVELQVVNLSNLPQALQEAEVEQLSAEIARKPFDLAFSPLLRVMLLQTSEQENLLLLVVHHIVCDGWSIQVLNQELAVLYEAFSAGKSSPLLELSIQYPDYSIWQHQWLQGEREKTQLSYWKQQLADAPTTLSLPIDRQRPPVQSFKGAARFFKLSSHLSDMVRSLSRQQGVTLFMTLLAVFQAQLYCYTSQEDICIGSPVANRNHTGIEGLIGFFVNTLVFRTDLSGNPSFLELLGRVREVCIGAYTHADLPFERLVEELHPERNLSHTPLFQVTFALQEDTKKDLVLPNLTLKWLHNNSETAKFDLTLYVVDSKPELWGWWEYNTDLFDAGTIERMVGHFTNLLEGIVTQPENRLSELPLLTEPERQTLLVDWNDTTTDFPQDKCIHELFEAQVARTPDAVAVVFEDQQLSYRELNQRANQLAHYLQKQGVKPEVLVGICVERSLDIVIGLLAILKAGGAYIPLDPSYPQERLAFILENAQISVLLTQTSLVEAIPQQKSQVVCLDAHWYYIAQQSKENLFSEVTPDNLAYVIYTSGSTGRPKGVMIKHASTVAMLDWANKTFEIEAKKGVLASTSICFDLSVFEIFVPLCCGGKVILIENALYLPTLSTSENVTLINTVPSVISQLLRNGCIPTSVKTVNIAGEPLYNQLVQELYRQENIQQVFNLYGPSEDTTYSTSAWIQKGSSNTPSIGRPIHNTQIYLLDKNCQPVPVGVPGMLYLGGAGLARGYLNKPELTANKFIPNPYTNQPGERLYKTGDQARYLPNGEIEYIGRIDYQVKVRGFRIELGEIEALIHQYPAVKETVVVVSEDSGDSKRLVAYVVPQTEQTLTISKLRDFLESKLPSYMIPGTFIILEALPLTPNGKLDRKALPIPELTQISSSNIILPTTPIENLLAGIWAKILGIEKVGIDNNFFELGGHSLIATRVMSQIRQVFQIELPLRCLFEKPTIAELAKEIETTNKAGLGIETTKIEPIVRSPQLPLSFAQQRLWFLAQLEPDSSFYNIPAAVRLKGELNIKALQQSLNEILRRHEALRTNFQTVEGQAIAVISEVKPLRLPTIDISELPLAQQEVEIRQQAAQEAQQPFDISSDYLLRVKLLRLDEQEHIVLLTMHHIASDGWSVGVLVQELATLYPSFCNHQPSPLPELPIQYVDFAAWQRQWLEAEVLQSQISYWRQQLEDAPKVLELPTDYLRPAIGTFRGATYSFELSYELSVALNKLSQQQGSTLFMTLLAAFQTLLWRYTGQEDIVVGSPIANRNRAEIEGLIGFFVNTLVLRTNLTGNPSFEELLKRVREVALGAYAHQDLPFELLVEQLQPQRDLSHTPLFQVMFVLQNAPMSALELPDLTLSPVESDSNTAKFDLTLYMSETESGLVGNLEYNTDLFAENSIQRMAAHLQTLLSGIVTNPQASLSELSLLTQTEKHQLLQEWNDTEVEYPQQLCIHELFEVQVQKTPDAVAVVFEDEQLTYWELNTRANQLAHYLQQLGVKPEVLVGICVERSLYMIIGLLAILKAGGAYVPLDPSYPKKRLAYMLEDSRPGLLLTQQHLVENLPTNQAQVICIDSDWQLIADENRENPGCNITVDNLAYVIYTSGSTGKPKGAINTHQGICNRLLWMQDAYQLTAADCVLHKTPFSFDVSVWEFFWTLMTGARLVVAQPEGHRDPSYIVNLILQQQITTLHFVPSMLQAFLSAEGLEKCQSLVRVIASGEALPVQLQQSFFNRLDAQLYNLYGPTEAAVDVTFWQCQDNLTNQTTVPIGRPIANIQIYLLDKYFNPVAFGVAGEVYIGGVGVGRGYLNRPDLTAEKFIPNPFSDKAAGRLYKTGDLARYLPTGEIEYIGRIDHQVKIRGFRIELGEIEALITKHPAVRETVVAVYCSQADSQQIVAYIVPQKEQTLVIPKLRSFLESKLPNYMIPATFATLEALPLTPNGKVDRKALPAPDTARPELEKAFIAPQTTAEKQLAVIWTQVLDLEKVGINDNFFELGGDSILILQIVSKANLAGLHLTPKQLFQHQTIAKLAAVAGTTQKISAQQNLITGSLELTPIEHWFFEQEQPEPHHWNQAVMLEVKQRINPVALEKVAEDLQKHHDALRSRFIKKELGLQAIIVSPDNVIPTTYLDLSALPKDQQVAQMEIMSDQLQASLNLTQGPLFRVAIFDLDANQPSRLLWVIHHLVVDGVSWRILIEDFQTAYEQICQNKALQLPPKTTSLQQWSSYLQEYAQSSALRSELEYWLTIEQQPVKPIPIDFSYENNLEESACTLTVSLTAEETQVLLQHVPAVYQTQINDVLLTALVQTFSQWTGETSLLIDLEGHGREELFEDIDLSRTVGWFTTIFPVHLSLNSAFDSPGKALKSIKEQLRAIPNRGIGYGVLRYLSEDMEISQRFSRLPKAEVVFNYLGQFDQVLPQSSLFGFATESTGPSNSLQSKRNHLLEVNGGISQGRLQINWTYSNQLHSQTTVETLAQSFIEALRVLITHCQSPDAGGFTPSDFAEFQQSQWEQSDLDAITAVIGNI
ncbi:non-ribosomal peptide synthetase [Nostoc sp. 'Lobaria pulmonaria (5183) cyanobiont']|uniref:non-ribosomal peptide synthetase n=1 Tax=Nostoc sp. 'Lobaria pulmonaria (5183) cyanobiont' TaxID=1618022 RepID=UPI000D0BF1F2|nr:non-ribosomal peptide synthetase [Nostoc sp. 'Lobaria pulmonaria (5183) cyanobiont']AVH69209.1 non-ribosomal peptide synthetase [Nostoc sp. 'Lobaria pulmonaria (5183) cyanobiont']